MTIASKTTLVEMRCVRAGAPFANVTAKSSIDTSDISPYISLGNTFFGVSDETTNTYTSTVRNTRFGAPYQDVPAKSTWDASFGQGRTHVGMTFTAKFSGTSTYVSTKRSTRFGAPHQEVTTKATWDGSFGQGRTRVGTPFVVEFAGTSVFPAAIKEPVSLGAPFLDVVTKTSINAEEFDFYRKGAPYWVKYTGAPPPFNASRFFLLF
jgi:hypothetical protein